MNTFLESVIFNPFIGKILVAFAGILIINIIIRFLQRTLNKQIPDQNAKYGVRRGLKFLGYILAILFTASVFSDQLSSLTVALGVAGAGIAFALQEIIVSIAGWVALSFGQFYRIGDRIQLGPIKGDVIDIGILRTTIMEIGEWVSGDLYSGRIVKIANSFVFKEAVYNYSADFPFLWDEIKLPIKYGSDYGVARSLIGKVANEVVGEYSNIAQNNWDKMIEKYAIEEASVLPIITLVANDNWAEFTLRYVVDYKKRRSIKDKIFEKILAEIEATNGAVSLASATFQIVETPTIDVRLREK